MEGVDINNDEVQHPPVDKLASDKVKHVLLKVISKEKEKLADQLKIIDQRLAECHTSLDKLKAALLLSHALDINVPVSTLQLPFKFQYDSGPVENVSQGRVNFPVEKGSILTLRRALSCKRPYEIVLGNTSRYLGDEATPEATHKWLFYVKGGETERNPISSLISQVRCVLHDSYENKEIVLEPECSTDEGFLTHKLPPFRLYRRGWGDFDMKVVLVFKDHRNADLNVIHRIKLDQSMTGIETCGAETKVIAEVFRELTEEEMRFVEMRMKNEEIVDIMNT